MSGLPERSSFRHELDGHPLSFRQGGDEFLPVHFPGGAGAGIFLPILANWSGWIFTEMGRQPWVVYGLLSTADARSPDVSMGSIIITLTGFILVYGILIAVGVRLFIKEIKRGPEDPPPPPAPDTGAPSPAERRPDLVLAY